MKSSPTPLIWDHPPNYLSNPKIFKFPFIWGGGALGQYKWLFCIVDIILLLFVYSPNFQCLLLRNFSAVFNIVFSALYSAAIRNLKATWEGKDTICLENVTVCIQT